jgi:membrane protease YdiL (CAAX protease family)
MTFYYIFVLVAALAGVVLLATWLIKTDWGTKALTGAEVRFNFMPDYLPFAVIFGWLILVTVSSSLLERITSNFAGWEQKFITYSGFILIEIFVMVLILKTVKRYFQDGLRGFGLRVRGIFPDIAAATAIFVVVWPMVLVAIYAVLYIGKMVVGPEFQIERNEGLSVILENNQLSLRILMIFFAVVVTPIFEELVFRGLLQSYLRNLNYGPWQSIFISSIIFSVLHPWMHIPALLVLSIAMGYAYEKSGSLLRPIFVHFLFNGITIAFTLLN